MNDELDERQRYLAREAARLAVRETFVAFGVDIEDPVSRSEFQRDLLWARSARQKGESVTQWVFRTVIVTGAGGAVYALWSGIKAKLGN